MQAMIEGPISSAAASERTENAAGESNEPLAEVESDAAIDEAMGTTPVAQESENAAGIGEEASAEMESAAAASAEEDLRKPLERRR